MLANAMFWYVFYLSSPSPHLGRTVFNASLLSEPSAELAWNSRLAWNTRPAFRSPPSSSPLHGCSGFFVLRSPTPCLQSVRNLDT